MDPAQVEKKIDRIAGWIVEDLGGTPEQQAKLAAIAKAAAKDLAPVHDELVAGRRQAVEILTAAQVDRAALEAHRARQMQLAHHGLRAADDGRGRRGGRPHPRAAGEGRRTPRQPHGSASGTDSAAVPSPAGMSDDVTMATRILMIEDDARLASMVAEDLGRNGLDVSVARTASEGLARLAREPFDLVLLDLMLPDADGLDVCRRIRAVGLGRPGHHADGEGRPDGPRRRPRARRRRLPRQAVRPARAPRADPRGPPAARPSRRGSGAAGACASAGSRWTPTPASRASTGSSGR